MRYNPESEIFTCDGCGGTFHKGRPDAEAIAEARDRFGDKLDKGVPIVLCGICREIFDEWLRTHVAH